MKIAVVALGVGNVRSVLRALERVLAGTTSNSSITATSDPEIVHRADVIVVPGQGSFGAFADAMQPPMREAIVSQVAKGTPYLGICLGLQILFDDSEEAPGRDGGGGGLGILHGSVRRLSPGIDAAIDQQRPLPHMGWNRSECVTPTPLFVADHFYFAHSFAIDAHHPSAAMTTTYGEASFASAIRKDNIVGVQFHPEKSQGAGLALLERFFNEHTKHTKHARTA